MKKSFVLLTLMTLALGCSSSSEDTKTGDSESELRRRRICGGFAGLSCPSGQTCVDDPSDSCDPNAGGADCSGICKVIETPPPPPPTPPPSEDRMCGGFAGLPC